MQFLLKRIILFCFFVIGGGFVVAQSSVDPMNLPKILQYVQDYSNILDQSSLQQLSSLGEAYNSTTTNQLVAVLFPNRNGNELFDIGMKLFNENQIGQAGKNNGLLLLISTEEKKIRIIVGYGLEGDLPDALVKRIIEEDIRPLVDSGDFAGAVRVFYERCSKAIDSDEGATFSKTITFSSKQESEGFWIFGLILGFILASLIKQKKISKSIKKIGIPLLIGIIVVLIVWLGALLLIGIVAGLVFGFTGFLPGRGGSGFGGGFGGGGGFSGGGGSSGGGGAGD